MKANRMSRRSAVWGLPLVLMITLTSGAAMAANAEGSDADRAEKALKAEKVSVVAQLKYRNRIVTDKEDEFNFVNTEDETTEVVDARGESMEYENLKTPSYVLIEYVLTEIGEKRMKRIVYKRAKAGATTAWADDMPE